MQLYNLKKYVFFSILFVISWLTSTIYAQEIDIKEADKLFLQKQYTEALPLLTSQLEKNVGNQASMHIKSAFIQERLLNIPATLYHLSAYNEIQPSNHVVEKMSVLAQQNNISGYERTDVAILFQFFKEYYSFFVGFFLLLGIYIFMMILLKRLNKKTVKARHMMLLISYCALLLLIINFPFNRQFVIVKKDQAILRNFASGAATVVAKLPAGQKLNYLGSQDIWLLVFHENDISYLKQSDGWVIK